MSSLRCHKCRLDAPWFLSVTRSRPAPCHFVLKPNYTQWGVARGDTLTGQYAADVDADGAREYIESRREPVHERLGQAENLGRFSDPQRAIVVPGRCGEPGPSQVPQGRNGRHAA